MRMPPFFLLPFTLFPDLFFPPTSKSTSSTSIPCSSACPW
eukprot:CAMPEP_0114626052 /NCGR_PEP_ID=MMETSP0168-20121206/11581_1 /TAXON_ID=95228 ORGANISM="Vannella sp., Strain DIVA3 517/6/12" /NCGR_SAMPLE_ID=MMETSP0168 /ASSEMBLY_ACC=CAM_ASM_000044 /LENGTH=39 /DNA_ID= /DNA_START= /DNA_END= /DNA_ORIENTATION=